MDLLFSLQQSVVSIQEQLKRTLMDKNWLFEGALLLYVGKKSSESAAAVLLVLLR